MILFFRSKADRIYAVGTVQPLQNSEIRKLTWLFGNADYLPSETLKGPFIGPRKENHGRAGHSKD
jgi:phosphoribosylformylglycinamidine synthase